MDGSKDSLVEVWGDTVNYKSMLLAILIGGFISTGVYYLAKSYFSTVSGDPTLLSGYAMLIGLMGCIASGFICSLLFKPARDIVTESDDDREGVKEFVIKLIEETPGYESVNELDFEVQKELELLKLKSVFLEAEEDVQARQRQL